MSNFGDSVLRKAQDFLKKRKSPTMQDITRTTLEYFCKKHEPETYGGIRRGGENEGFFRDAYMNNTYLPDVRLDTRPGLSQSKPPVCVITPEEEAAQKPTMDLPRMNTAEAQTSVDELTADVARRAEKLFGYSALRESLKIENPLLVVLRKLDIEPFQNEAVEAYMKQASLFRQKELKQQIVKAPNFSSMSQSWVNHQTMAIWREIRIEDYSYEIPIHVLNTAVQIKEELPAAEFNIHELLDDPFLSVEYDGLKLYVAVWAEKSFEASVE